MNALKITLILGGLGGLSFLGWKRFAPFSYSIRRLSPSDKNQMRGVSWNSFCPVPIDSLVKVKIRYFTNWGLSTTGTLIIHRQYASNLVGAFRDLYNIRYPFISIKPIRFFGGSDPISMRNNNTSAFRCSTRERAAKKRRGTWSEHSQGQAIDINPLVNPFVMRSGKVDPPEGQKYADRNIVVKGTVTPDVVRIFARHGWKWGGNWKSSKDYQHFSIGGR